ncbi:MAG: hypothetical protein U0939_05620 [Pirellulales bacterium]
MSPPEAYPELDPALEPALDQALGYLNFSAGSQDNPFLANLNRLFAAAGPCRNAPPATWQVVVRWLQGRRDAIRGKTPAFSDTTQVDAVLDLLANHVLPAYLDFHRDLLFHQNDQSLFNSLFLGRVCEAILKQGGPWDETDRIVRDSIRTLNDYVGHRPVATLEQRKLEIYAHERLRPVPLYVRGAGVAPGPTEQVVTAALKLLEETDAEIRRAAHFDLALLDELSFDPRAYDFDHPANKRPNYHFGQWDPHQIDLQGRYRRFVVQQVTLNALMQRVWDGGPIPHEQLVTEAAAVLAGTILMASGVSGSGPDTHDSSVTLSNLLPNIARYRDRFYERLIRRMTGAHAERLGSEAAERQQPFGGARQHLNAELARRRASQVEHVHLAKIFARMGFPAAASRQAAVVPTASARMICQIDCWLAEGQQAIRAGDVESAVRLLGQIRDMLRRAISCGAIIDPWNILGFDANFSLFPSPDNSIHDHRADELCALMDHLFSLYGQAWSESVVRGNDALSAQIKRQFRELVDWWHPYATHAVTSVEAVNALEAYRGAELVTDALRLWHEAGGAAGNVAFWAPHADMFQSPQAYALVLEKLLAQHDFVASRALLIHWLSQAAKVGLTSGESSFSIQAERWVAALLRDPDSWHAHDAPATSIDSRDVAGPPPATSAERQQRWNLARKFFDFLEVNAEDYWRVPTFELAGDALPKKKRRRRPRPRDDEFDEQFGGEYAGEFGEEESNRDDLESATDAAWDGVVYRGAQEDDIEGSIIEPDQGSQDELTREGKRISQRLDFLTSIARLWRLAALYTVRLGQARTGDAPDERLDRVAAWERAEVLERWSEQASANCKQLLELLESVRNYPLPKPASRQDSMIEYDQRRYAKESLMEQIVETAIETVDARRLLLAGALAQVHENEVGTEQLRAQLDRTLESLEPDQSVVTQILAALFRDDLIALRAKWPEWLRVLRGLPLLYVPISRNGNPNEIVEARLRQRSIQDLLTCLPRRGCYLETCQLVDAARQMERNHSVGAGAVTEFDELFKVGFKTMVDSLIASAVHWPDQPTDEDPDGAPDGDPDGDDEDESESDADELRTGERDDAKWENDELGETDDELLLADAPKGWTASPLVTNIEQLTESMLLVWLTHSKTLRLSVLEKLQDSRSWKKVVKFIEQYGADLFTQHFLNLGNVRSILHRGVREWLRQLQEDGEVEIPLLEDLNRAIPRDEAVEQLTLILEAIHENYGEYRDYNSTTTQSDRGEMLFTLLDFLRLRTRYDRIAWNLKPVVWAHEVLVRMGQVEAAETWRRALHERVDEQAARFLRDLAELQKRYAMRMPTVADRLGERFLRPLSIDRIRALVEPAMQEAARGGPHPAFDLLEDETETLTRQPTGVGLDVPPWLLALEEEVDRVRDPLSRNEHRAALQSLFAPRPIDPDTLQAQLAQFRPKE